MLSRNYLDKNLASDLHTDHFIDKLNRGSSEDYFHIMTEYLPTTYYGDVVFEGE